MYKTSSNECMDSSKAISCKAIDHKLFKKYNKIWGKIKNLLNIKFDSEPVYGDDDKYIKTKIKTYGDKVNTNFQGKKVPKESASYKCLLLIMLESVIKANKKNYAQTLLEECKYEIKTKMENIDDELESGSSDESDSETDNETESDNEIW